MSLGKVGTGLAHLKVKKGERTDGEKGKYSDTIEIPLVSQCLWLSLPVEMIRYLRISSEPSDVIRS